MGRAVLVIVEHRKEKKITVAIIQVIMLEKECHQWIVTKLTNQTNFTNIM